MTKLPSNPVELSTDLTPAGRALMRTSPAGAAFDVARVRANFPILRQTAHGRPLVYLDNAATTQKPQGVIDAVRKYYESGNANIHRGVYKLSEDATAAYEGARRRVQRFINAASEREIIFTRGTTESINLVAATFGRKLLKAGDEILLSAMEHHSNIVPWQLLCEQTGAVIRVAPIDDRGQLRMDELERLLSPRTKLVSIVQVSNALGTINPVRHIIELAHAAGAAVLVDGAQWVAHGPTDVRALGADFYVFSGHKLYGPTGIGILWGREKHLEAMPPYQGGGDMISSVTFEKTTYNDLPYKFEAGTPNIAGAVGLAAAIDYVDAVGLDRAAAHEAELLAHATRRMEQIGGVRIVGTATRKSGVISFVVDDPPMAPQDIGNRLDLEGIAVRTGHHCCQPLMDRFGIVGTARMSLAMYNTREEVDAFADALQRTVESTRQRKAALVVPDAGDAVRYPEPSADSPQEAADELVEMFELLGEDWADRYQYLIELGEKLPPMPGWMKTEANRVHGCQSIVHMHARRRPGDGDRVDLLADSNADIVRGLIGLLMKLYAAQPAREVERFDVEGLFHRLGLDQHLTMGRRNGLSEMVKRVRAHARRIAEGDA